MRGEEKETNRRRNGKGKDRMDKVRLGLIGAGNIGSAHVQNWLEGKCPEIILSAVADRRESRREWAKERLPEAAVFTEGEELIASGTCDAVLIAVPHYQHPALAISAFEHGLHVMCEKPAGVYTLQVREMIAAADRHPEDYIAYLAMSQTCDQYQSELIAYDYMRGRYEELGDRSMVRRFGKYEIRESDEDYEKYTGSGLRDKAMHALGVGTTSDMDNVITDLFFPSLRVKAYTPGERIGSWRGKAAAGKFAVHRDSRLFNAFTAVL